MGIMQWCQIMNDVIFDLHNIKPHKNFSLIHSVSESFPITSGINFRPVCITLVICDLKLQPKILYFKKIYCLRILYVNNMFWLNPPSLPIIFILPALFPPNFIYTSLNFNFWFFHVPFYFKIHWVNSVLPLWTQAAC